MTALLDRWLGFADRISHYAIWAGGTLVLASAILVSVDVLLRKLFLVSLGLRSVDLTWCQSWVWGTHWAWHLLNGVVLGLVTLGLARAILQPR